MEDTFLSSDLEELKKACMAIKDVSDEPIFFLPQGSDRELGQVVSPGILDLVDFTDANNPCLCADQSLASKEVSYKDLGWTDSLSINTRDLNISPNDLRIHLKHDNQSENVSSELYIAGASNMEDKLLSSDLEELKKACMAIKDVSDELIFFLPQESLQALSPGVDVHGCFIDQGHGSKVFMDNDWLPPVPSPSSFHKDIDPVSEFEGEKLEQKTSGLIKRLRVESRFQNIDPKELGINFFCQNLPVQIFSKQPSFQFIAGKVSYTKEECLRDFLRQLEPSSHTQGCLLKEILSVEDGEYTEDKQLTHSKSLYQGEYGKVDLCQDNVSGYEFIRKKIRLEKFRPTEVLFPLTIKYKNIMKICGVIQRVEMDGKNIMEILMDNAGMSLVAFVVSRPEKEILSQALIWDLMKQALEGLSMLHSKGIIHLDIKPENLCVQEDNKGCLVLTITDFGSAMIVDQEIDFVGWTPEYMAPESCRCYLHAHNKEIFSKTNNQITGKVDVFSLGLTALFLHEKKHVLLNLLTEGQNSYSGLPLEKKKLLQLQLLKYLACQENPVGHLISDDCSTDMRDLLSSMLTGSADIRPTAEEALAYMIARVQDVEQTISQPATPRPDVLAPMKRNTRGRHSPSNPQFKTEKGRLVTQPSCNSSDYISGMTEVPVCQLTLPKSINCLPENEPGPIKDHMLKQRLREKLNPYKKAKEIETSNPTPMFVKHSCRASTQSPASASKIENCKRNIGQNVTQAEQLEITLLHEIPDTKPVQPSSPTDPSINMVDLCGNIPNFDILVNI